MRPRIDGSLLVSLLTALAGCKPAPNATAETTASAIGAASAVPPVGATATTTVPSSAAPSASAAPKPPPGPIDPAMVRLPAGTYHQGSAGATQDDFAWQHTESVPAFDLDVTEVTVEAYQACLDAGACTYVPRSTDCNLERERDEYKRDPVNCVTWAEAVKFCAWRGAELPTDGMWEYAAGGRRGWHWPWSEQMTTTSYEPQNGAIHRRVAIDGLCLEGPTTEASHMPHRIQYHTKVTCPVGSLPRGDTPDKLKDMTGNVAEWTSSLYCRHHKELCEDGVRTVKGGAFDGVGLSVIEYRMSIDEKTWQPNIGFRCTRVVNTDSKKGR
jgi:formylglycine-generating enzyme required for sulfatase activity